MKITLRRTHGAQFEARNESGNVAMLDGPADVGGKDGGVRPMEMLLMSLGGCSAMDVLLILQKQRQEIADLDISVEGTRAQGIPSVFEQIHLHFTASGPVDPAKLERAVSLSMEKYCSVAKMLDQVAAISFTSEVKA